MSIASVTTRGYNPPGASIALVTLLGYGGTGGAPPADQPAPPRGGAPIWWYGSDLSSGGDDRRKKRRELELELERKKREEFVTTPVKVEAPKQSERVYKPPLSVAVNNPKRVAATGPKRSDAWLRTAERFRNRRKKREESEK